MTDHTHKPKNGTEPRSVRKNIALESGAFTLAEGASMATSLGVVAIFDKVMPQALMDKATNAVAKIVIQPYLDTIEKTLAKCHLAECQTDETKSREERAQRLARGLIVFSTAYFTALGAKLYIRRKANTALGVNGENHTKAEDSMGFIRKKLHQANPTNWSPEERMIFFADEAAHIGSLVYLNTTASKFTDEHIDKMANTLEKLGMSHKKAKEVASMAMVWEVPNALGVGAGMTAIAGKHAKGWAMKDKHLYNNAIIDVISGKAMAPTNSKI